MNEDIGKKTLTGREWITSDTHFFHRNIMRYCGRPWSDVTEMNKAMIDRWNSVVKTNDIVFHLGDFALCGTQAKAHILSQLSGHLIFVKGNHDSGRTSMLSCGCKEAYLQVEGRMIDGRTFVMSHIPKTDQFSSFDVQFVGHVHTAWAMLPPNVYNVGCDIWGFVPQRIDHVMSHASNRQLKFMQTP